MTSLKQLIYSERRRLVPAQFSWIDQRLVRDGHLDRLDVHAAALYLFLVTVADAQGLSWYGDASTARRLSIDAERLRHARNDLVQAGLVAYAAPLYQVLALGDPPASVAPPPQATAEHGVAAQAGAELGSESERMRVSEHLKALHDALGKRL